MGKKSADKKRKAAPGSDAAAPAPAAGFSLFGGKKDSELGNVFSASAGFALAAPAAPAAPKRVKIAKKKAEEVKEVEAEVAEVEAEKMDVEEAEAEAEAEESVSDTEENAGDETLAVDEDEPASDAESDISLTHEAVKKAKAKAKKLPTYIPAGETSEERDRRTVFVGNIDLAVTRNKSSQNALRAHLLTFAPSAKIESVRFRSVAFATPTAALPAEDEKEANRRAKREKERVAQWRATQAEGSTVGGPGNRRGEDEVVDKSKSYLDSKGKRKVAFIKGEFHSDAAACNAYVVFAYAHPDRAANVAPIMSPFEAVDAVLAANGSTFQERTIRVDRVRLASALGLAAATNALGKRDAWLPAGMDPKMSLFVGGLDYAAKDEDVRVYFEALVTAERGAPEAGHWVTGVRIVRDKDTQLGKGFGYVHFVDRESVDEMIALPSAKLKFAKKPLRVQVCRSLPPNVRIHGKPAGGAAGAAGAPGASGKPAKKTGHTGPIPRGNPALGDKIKDLTKDERKAVKATDAERQARRIAKKKLGVANAHKETGAVKLAATKAEKKRTDKKVKAKKGRVRSSHALSKMKGSRT